MPKKEMPKGSDIVSLALHLVYQQVLAFKAMHENSSPLAALGRKVRTLRKERGLTQMKLAESAGVHRTYLADIERGARNLSFLNLAKLARALETNISELTVGVEHEEDASQAAKNREKT
jgi:DNA-binding XRE family transcriptional regulator